MPKIPPAPASAESNPQSEEELQKSIAQRYDKLNALWVKAEESLRKLLVPHRVYHCYSSYTDEDEQGNYSMTISDSISWAKLNGTWRICHECSTDIDPSDVSIRAVTDCQVDIRLELIKHFPTLREKVIEEAQKYVESLDKAIADFTSVLK